jgi:hypothetical protein
MPELFNVLPPAQAYALLLRHFEPRVRAEEVDTASALDRVLAEPIASPADLPSPRSALPSRRPTCAPRSARSAATTSRAWVRCSRPSERSSQPFDDRRPVQHLAGTLQRLRTVVLCSSVYQ